MTSLDNDAKSCPNVVIEPVTSAGYGRTLGDGLGEVLRCNRIGMVRTANFEFSYADVLLQTVLANPASAHGGKGEGCVSCSGESFCGISGVTGTFAGRFGAVCCCAAALGLSCSRFSLERVTRVLLCRFDRRPLILMYTKYLL